MSLEVFAVCLVLAALILYIYRLPVDEEDDVPELAFDESTLRKSMLQSTETATSRLLQQSDAPLNPQMTVERTSASTLVYGRVPTQVSISHAPCCESHHVAEIRRETIPDSATGSLSKPRPAGLYEWECAGETYQTTLFTKFEEVWTAVDVIKGVRDGYGR